MSLLPSMTAPNANNKYFVENIGGNGQLGNDVPCIKAGAVFGAVRVADGDAGMVLVGGGIGNTPLISGVRGGGAAGTTLNLGSSTASQSNIVLTDALTTINTSVNLAAVGADLTVADQITLGGNLVFSAAGSISGYYNATTASASYPDATDTAIANPAGLTVGWYIVAAQTAAGGQQEQQVNVIVHRSAGGLWDIGGSVRSVAGAGTFGFKPSADRTTMVVQNSTGVAQTATIYWAKLLN